MCQKFETADAFVLWVSIGKMLADVAQCGGAEEGVADGVEQNVGIAVANQAMGVRNFYAANP